MNARLRRLCLAALLPSILAPVASAQAPTPGEKWRTSMSMEMMGMKMPGMTNEVCSPKNANQAPMEPDKDCTISNRKRVGNTDSFDMVCTGKSQMTGHMEMTQESPTRWRGKMLAKTKDGEMTMNYSGEKLPGECDASEMERKMNKLMADGEAARARQCLESAKGAGWLSFLGETASCKDAASVKAYCGVARTSTGYNTLARQQRMGARVYTGGEAARYRTILADTGKLCGFSPETVRTQYCSTARQKEEWTFFAEECPELAKPLAQAQCAGRDFTTPVDPPFVKFCGAFAAAGSSVAAPSAAGGGASGTEDGAASAKSGAAGGASDGASGSPGSEQPETPTDKAKDALNKGKQALKGLFGR